MALIWSFLFSGLEKVRVQDRLWFEEPRNTIKINVPCVWGVSMCPLCMGSVYVFHNRGWQEMA